MSREILMPQVASDMTEADVVAWLVEPGDEFALGDVLLEIETEKSTVEIEAPAAGSLSEILIPAGTSGVAVGVLLARLEEAPQAAEALAEEPGEARSGPELDAGLGNPPVLAAESAPSLPPEARPPATALARRMADRSGLDLEGLQGTGSHGRVIRDDVTRGTERGAPAQLEKRTEQPGEHPPGPASNLELLIECRAEALVDTLARLNRISPKGAEQSPMHDMILRAVYQAAVSVPAFFAGTKTEPLDSGALRIVSAVPAGSTAESPESADLVIVDLGRPEVEVVRLGPPSAAFPRTLGVGSPREAAVAMAGEVACGQVLTLSLSVDPRIVAANVAAEWVSALRACIEAPLRLLL